MCRGFRENLGDTAADVARERSGARTSREPAGCVSRRGQIERMDVSGTMYGGYLTSDQSLFDFRFLEWQKPFQINYHNRGFFDVAGTWHGPQLVLDRPNEQGIKLNTGPFIDNATVTLHWTSYEEFETACRSKESAAQ